MYFSGSEVNHQGHLLGSLTQKLRSKVTMGSFYIHSLFWCLTHAGAVPTEKKRAAIRVTVWERWLRRHHSWTYYFTNEQSGQFSSFIGFLDKQLMDKCLHFLSHSPTCDPSIAPFLSGYKLFSHLWLSFFNVRVF